jgi:acyl-coenzyme A thioesterase PaaI-like protein
VKTTLDELARLVAGSDFLRSFNFTVDSCAPGECVLILPFAAALERPGGVVTGIALMGAADVAMWLAIMTLRGTAEQWVTTDLKTAFLKGARNTKVLCAARVLKVGKRTAYGTAECRSDSGDLLAHHVVSYALLPG